MRKIIYDVAQTIDGYICHKDGSADGFVPDGPHVRDYQERLQQYDTVIMGRKTYEFGYQFGLKPGDRAYPHMEHFIFSKTLQLHSDDIKVVDRLEVVAEIKNQEGGIIYLCGGGEFAGELLDRQWIDELVIKLNPVVFGGGIGAFGQSHAHIDLELMDSKAYENGVNLLRYAVRYG